MLRLDRLLIALLLVSVSACGLLAEKPPAQPAAAPPPAVPPVNPELEPAPRIILPVPIPPPKPRQVSPSKKKNRGTEHKPGNAEPPASEAPEPSKPAPVSRRKKPLAPIEGPAWLQYCSERQQSPTGILCDANTLLTKPSAKVQVYVREAALARDTPSGRILLREGLPRLYRFFVIP